jgi:hypothetical protein
MQVLNHYDVKDISYTEDLKYRSVRKDVNRFTSQALELIGTGDDRKIEQGYNLYADARAMITSSGLSFELQMKLERSMLNPKGMVDVLTKTRGQSPAARITAQASQGE